MLPFTDFWTLSGSNWQAFNLAHYSPDCIDVIGNYRDFTAKTAVYSRLTSKGPPDNICCQPFFATHIRRVFYLHHVPNFTSSVNSTNFGLTPEAFIIVAPIPSVRQPPIQCVYLI